MGHDGGSSGVLPVCKIGRALGVTCAAAQQAAEEQIGGGKRDQALSEND